MSFCRNYNRIMKKLHKDYKPVSSVNILSGIIILFILEPLSAPVLFVGRVIHNVLRYIFSHLPKIDISKIDIEIIDEFVVHIILIAGITFLDYLAISATIWFNVWWAWAVGSAIIYVLTSSIISILIDMYSSKVSAKVFEALVVHPIYYLISKTTSECELLPEDTTSWSMRYT